MQVISDAKELEFQSTPPSRVATFKFTDLKVTFLISIHTTLAGVDTPIRTIPYSHPNFNPHHPRGWRLARSPTDIGDKIFQSTPPSRVATDKSVRKERDKKISIHTTLAGGDDNCDVSACSLFYFNPHHPRGWRPFANASNPQGPGISIHTTLAGGDPRRSDPGAVWTKEFQSTPPSRVATEQMRGNAWRDIFQSTPPSRVATLQRQIQLR